MARAYTLTSLAAATLMGGALFTAPTAQAAGADRFGCNFADATAANLYASHRSAFAGDTVVLARQDDYADGLAATPLAVELKAPILVTRGNELSEWARDAIEEQNVRDVVVVGGQAAISDGVVSELRRLGVSVRRVTGATRTETAANLAREVVHAGSAEVVYLATGLNFPDALTAGAAAAHAQGVVLLSSGRSLDETTLAALRELRPGRIVAVGGDAVQAARAARLNATEMAGHDRFETGRLVAQGTFDKPANAVVVSGLQFGHALPASAWAGATSAPLLLTAPNHVPDSTRDYLATTGATPTVIGGAEQVDQAVVDELSRIARGDGASNPSPSPTPTVTPAPTPAPSPTPTAAVSAAAWEQRVLDLTNAARREHGLPPFQSDACAGAVAREWSTHMLATDNYVHRSDWQPLWACRNASGGTAGLAENIFRGSAQWNLTPEKAVEGWMNSPGHRANILNPNYTHIGIGFAGDYAGNHFATQNFWG